MEAVFDRRLAAEFRDPPVPPPGVSISDNAVPVRESSTGWATAAHERKRFRSATPSSNDDATARSEGAAPGLGGTSRRRSRSGLARPPSRGQSYAPTVNKMSLAAAGSVPLRRNRLDGTFSTILWGYTGIIGGFPPRPPSRANPSPCAAKCLTNKGSLVGFRSGILAAGPNPLISNLLWPPLAAAGGPPHDGSHDARPGESLPPGSRCGSAEVGPGPGSGDGEGRSEVQIGDRGCRPSGPRAP